MNNECFSYAYGLWNDFLDQIIYKQRYFLKHKILDHIKEHVENNARIISPDYKFYRARKYSENIDVIDFYGSPEEIEKLTSQIASETNREKQLYLLFQQLQLETELKKEETGFWGYPKGSNLLPPKETCVDNGRANPPYIRYLYLSESPYTCLAEVRPLLDDKISIAEIKSNKELKVADFSYDYLNQDRHSLSYYLLYYINRAFQKTYTGDLRDYLPSQYIAEFIKSEGFDGIKYNSSMHRYGINYTFYFADYFEDLNSKIYELDRLYMRAKCCNTPLEDDLLHPDLNYNILSKTARRLDRLVKKRIMDYNFDHPDIKRGKEQMNDT